MENLSNYVLVTGGAGYIGTHVCLQLLVNDYNVVVIDNLSNSAKKSLLRVEKITKKNIIFIQGDICCSEFVENIFEKYKFNSVMHFAGLKSVSKSALFPIEYYNNNVLGTINILRSMGKRKIKKFVFSSSATVYGYPEVLPIPEEAHRYATNPYGQSKIIVENMLEDIAKSDSEWKIACLRYFNPVGADVSGLIGEDPLGVPNNIMPYISQVAIGKQKELVIFGADYPTIDGTGVRDYIHVTDLAKGHLAALNFLFFNNESGFLPFNLGRGEGVSVFELLKAFEKVSGHRVPYTVSSRRLGDVAICYADPKRANTKLGWFAEHNIHQMCEDAWRWQKNNPNGYCP